MSVEWIVGIIIASFGTIGTLAALWDKITLPHQIGITYRTWKVLKAATNQKDSVKRLYYPDLYERVVADFNENTEGRDFKPDYNKKRKKIDALLTESIGLLENPIARVDPLILTTVIASKITYELTELGEDIHDVVQSGARNMTPPETLDGILKGSLSLDGNPKGSATRRSTETSRVDDETIPARTGPPPTELDDETIPGDKGTLSLLHGDDHETIDVDQEPVRRFMEQQAEQQPEDPYETITKALNDPNDKPRKQKRHRIIGATALIVATATALIALAIAISYSDNSPVRTVEPESTQAPTTDTESDTDTETDTESDTDGDDDGGDDVDSDDKEDDGDRPAPVFEIEGAAFAAPGTETVFTLAHIDAADSVVWAATGPDGFTTSADTESFGLVAPAGGAYTITVTVVTSSNETLTDVFTLNVFDDIAAQQFIEEILWLAESEITTGCSQEPLLYCPDSPVTRAQVASFLARALGLEALEQPVEFDDVDPVSVHASDIEALYAAEITLGCSREPLLYCPDSPVTRAQVASFLARALGLEALEQPVEFDDVDPVSVHASDIEALYAAEITLGCSREPLLYCPDSPVTRAQMAAFLYRARHLVAAAVDSS